MLFAIIVNAAEEATSEVAVNEASNFNNSNSKINDRAEQYSVIDTNKNNQNNEKNGSPVTASFGVYLNIVG